MKWEKVKLGDVSESCLGKMLDQRKNKGTYKPYLANINVRWGSFDLENLQKMKFEEHENKRYGIKYGDLIICEGGEPGRCAIWKEEIPNMKIQKALHRVRLKDEMDYRYVYYWFLLAGKTGALKQYYTGATIMHMPGEKLKEVTIDKPPLVVQKRIRSHLEAFDNLIENNKKQIKLLEEAAQRLYKEWFVDLRFPGHEDVAIVDGIPERWKKVVIKDICLKMNAGGTPTRNKASFWDNATIKWYKTGELQDCWLIDSEEYISMEGLNCSSAKLFPKNTVVIAIYASPTLGRLGILSDEAACNQAALCLVADEEKCSWQWLYQKLYELRDDFNMIARGAGQQNISAEVVKMKEILLPEKILIEQYTKIVEKQFSRRLVLQLQNKILTEARDRLLPKLMNGEIEV